MKIHAIDVYAVELLQSSATEISGGRVIDRQDSTIVAVRADDGMVGWAESCPWSPVYLPTFAGAIRAALELLGPALLGADPCNLAEVSLTMQRVLAGQEQAKHAIDTACHDLLARSLGVPLHQLLGGMATPQLLYAGFLHRERGLVAAAAAMAAYRGEGRPHFEVKASGDVATDVALVRALGELLLPGERLKVDANGGWSVADAAHVFSAAGEHDVWFEQPCATYDDCRRLRARTERPIILDECVVDMATLLRGIVDGVADAVNLKVARVGGLGPARAMRDVCIAHGIPLIVQCVGGSELTAAAIAHLAHGVPPHLLLSVWDGTAMITTEVGDGHHSTGWSMRASTAPGLGITPNPAVLGDPIASFA